MADFHDTFFKKHNRYIIIMFKFAHMIHEITITMPMMVCGILSVLLGLSLYSKWDKPRFALLLFMLTAALLYWGHSIYFYHQMKLITLSDTIYSFCNPAVFPLFLHLYRRAHEAPNEPSETISIFSAIHSLLCSSRNSLCTDG